MQFMLLFSRQGKLRLQKWYVPLSDTQKKKISREVIQIVLVCELDIIFNFEKAYYILDEFILGGEAQETSKKNVLKAIEQADMLQEEAETPRSVLEEIGLT
uniref:AP complex subunit sigma n=1 Tax=Cyprinus carpio TaxID=7962 RepID=A0A8C1WFD0_CYPCA